MFYAKKLISALLLPPAGPVLLAFLGLWLSRRHPRTGRAIAAFALLGLLALSLPPVAAALMRGLEDRPPISAQQLARVQAIVVIGCGKHPDAPEYGGDTAGPCELERLRYAVRLQKRTGLPILVSGGSLAGQPEAEVMKEAAERDFGGKVEWVEGASRDTAENAAFTAKMLAASGVTRIALVSQAWHLKRATELFARRGLEVFPAPTGYTPSGESAFEDMLPSAYAFAVSAQALHEWLGLLAQRFNK